MDLAVLYTYAALLFGILLRAYADRKWLRPCLELALLLWAAVVLWVTLFNRRGEAAFQVNWIPFHSYWEALSEDRPEILRSSMMNVALFFPAGLIAAGLHSVQPSAFRSRFFSVSALWGFSLGIELIQCHLRLGIGEIDDVIHNTLGAALGFLAFRLDPGKIHADIP
jgi:glycopeptide antibiotics resistance protein